MMRQMRVLLVDDEIEFVKTLAKRLEMREINPDTAYSGEEAIQYVEEQEPDVIVLDLRMPGMYGIEVLKQIRKAYPTTQVIILTAHGSEKDEEEAEKLGAYEFLRKPVDIETLIDTIKNAYQRKLELTMSTVEFAETREFDTTIKIIENKEEK